MLADVEALVDALVDADVLAEALVDWRLSLTTFEFVSEYVVLLANISSTARFLLVSSNVAFPTLLGLDQSNFLLSQLIA